MKLKSLISVVLFSVFFTVTLIASGCGSACEDLANRVCDCQPTRSKKTRCKYNISAASKNFDLSDTEEDICQSILDSGECTCDAIDAGNFFYCGLSSDPLFEEE